MNILSRSLTPGRIKITLITVKKVWSTHKMSNQQKHYRLTLRSSRSLGFLWITFVWKIITFIRKCLRWNLIYATERVSYRIPKGVEHSRLSTIGYFCENDSRLLALNYFQKKKHHRGWVLNTLLIPLGKHFWNPHSKFSKIPKIKDIFRGPWGLEPCGWPM